MYFQKPFSFKGRISRGEYFLSLIVSIVSIYGYPVLCATLVELTFLNVEVNKIIMVIFYFPILFFVYWLQIAQGAKRCHDLGRSGWFQLIPFYGFVMLFAKGDIGETGWGPDPLIEVEEKGDEEVY